MRFPYPLGHYLQLFRDTIDLINICSLSGEKTKKEWCFILKLSLYMKHKKIGLNLFGSHLFKNNKLKSYLEEELSM